MSVNRTMMRDSTILRDYNTAAVFVVTAVTTTRPSLSS